MVTRLHGCIVALEEAPGSDGNFYRCGELSTHGCIYYARSLIHAEASDSQPYELLNEFCAVGTFGA